jgi:UDPglucose 6-dehydrogenase
LAEALRVGVVGTGYVGLVTGSCLAFLGHRVTCVDRDEERVRVLSSGRMPVYEPGLEELVARGAGRESLDFAGDEGLAALVEEADVLFVAVGTLQGEDGSADLTSVAAAGAGSSTSRSPRTTRSGDAPTSHGPGRP